jgi:hypothetical protein
MFCGVDLKAKIQMTEILQAVWFISHYSESPTQNHFKN